MESIKAWVSSLQVDKQDYESWLKSKPTDEPETFWILQSGHLETNKYFAWAKNHYGLPVLSDDYCSLPAQLELWNKVKTLVAWAPSVVPIEEWDGVIFIGCVEPLEAVPFPFPVVYILATPKTLKSVWQSYHDNEQTFLSIPPVPSIADEGPIGLELDLDLSVPAAATTANPFMQDNIPTGLIELPDFGSLSMAGSTAPFPVPGFESVLPAEPARSSILPPQFLLKPQAAVENLQDATTLEQALNWLAKNALTFYQHLIFFKYTSQGLNVLKVTPNLNPIHNEALQPVDPTKASVFRIVKRTNMPYHGPVIDSDTNKAFFSNWGFEQYPPIVTTLPLLSGDQNLGQILAMGDEKCAPQEILQKLERLATMLAPVLKQWDSKAA